MILLKGMLKKTKQRKKFQAPRLNLRRKRKKYHEGRHRPKGRNLLIHMGPGNRFSKRKMHSKCPITREFEAVYVQFEWFVRILIT